jgi:Bacterial proteasome activator
MARHRTGAGGTAPPYACVMDSEIKAVAADTVTPEVVDGPPVADDAEDSRPHVSEPSKLIRIASMTRAMLDEVREAPLDEAGRQRLVAIYDQSIDELREVLSDDLVEELDAVFIPITDVPSEAELRIAQAQLVGWLEGLFHGIQASLISQQMAASAQLERMKYQKALDAGESENDGRGLYL